jgi:hypothetical protein
MCKPRLRRHGRFWERRPRDVMFNEKQRWKVQQSSLIALCLSIGLFVWGGVSLGAPVADLRTLLPAQDLPAGWALAEGPRTYSKKTLFEHVNGQAVLYLSYGFQRSVFAVFQNGKEPENQIEVDIYDLGNVLNAFGVFSRFRNDDRPGGVGLDSYVDDRSFLFYKGRYFVMLYATETNASVLKQLAMTLSSKIVDSSPPPKEIDLFPKNGLKAGSIQYFPEGLLGHTFLGRGFQASYVDEGDPVPPAQAGEPALFLAIFKTPQAAKDALTTYRSYISKKGKLLPWTPATLGPDAWKGEDPYQGPLIVVQKGLHLGGARGFPEKRGELHVETFMKRLR